ncbi:uncharacterized protein LOC100373113 [Saccoglossus kowalevskii]|uniref:Uncharacterized protein LOC100373113 n=1 Tax=Saccoglossus kowalevskii TaxID=10224 RepID=A0ABM0M6Y9_SACKO|nr:PREDICTED: uncharacterized protein LOC100373113 [Saccoglossus kowalevskii]
MQLKENPDMEITYDEKEYIVYLLNSNAGGQLLKNCFDRAATEDRNRPFLVTPTATAKLYEDARASKTLPNRVLMGENLLGICDIVAPASCSYFTILSDPIERIVSTYVQALSSGVLQEGESIKNWAFRQRDYFLNQLLQTAESCSEPNGDGAAEVEIAIQSHPDESLDVALIGITEWFKLVCNSADMTGCLRALQLAYGLDLSVCIDDFAGLKPAGKDMDPALAQLLEDQTTDGDYKGKTPLEKLKNKLQQDEEISDVMHADSQCYQKVVQTARIEDEEVDKRRRK